MAEVIGFAQIPKEEPKLATCPNCSAIIRYTNKDVQHFQIQGPYITCPNCNKWFTL